MNSSFVIIALFSLLIAADFSPSFQKKPLPADWSYSGSKGTPYWYKLHGDDYKGCRSDKAQSPINIVKRKAVNGGKSKMKDIIVPRMAEYKVESAPVGIKLKCKRHGECGKLRLDGTTYSLEQAHMHARSEHLINGKAKDFELHMVHSSEDGKLAVVGILFKGIRCGCSASTSFNRVLKAFKDGKPIMYNLGKLMKNRSGYFRYTGGLTTPPCVDPLHAGVQWVVQDSVRSVPYKQIRRFRRINGYGPRGNWRPVQPMNGRVLKKYG